MLVLAVVLVGSLGVVTAATASGLGRGPAQLFASAASVAYAPLPGATDVAPGSPTSITVSDGVLDQVTLTADGAPVAGTLNADRTSWTPTEALDFGTTYEWSGTVTGGDGSTTPLQGSFVTATPDEKLRATINISDDRTVGVAAPVQIRFDGHVEDRAAAERALSVTTSVPVEGSWGWLADQDGGSRVDYRTKEYWPANTTVTVNADLFGVSFGDGAYGANDVSTTFQIGRSQIVKADVNTYRMIVIRDGQQVADFPASYGLESDPERNTRNGIHVVMEKYETKRMTSARYGYDVVVKWAVRMSNNGEFVHANPATVASQGSANVTHGCVNLSTENAKAYYDSVLYGDPVEVTGSSVQLSEKDGDIWDWTLTWDQWKALSAL